MRFETRLAKAGGSSLRSGRIGVEMYVGGIVAVLLLLFAVLMMLGIVPMTPVIIGGMFIGVCVGFAGPYIIRTA